MVYSTTADVRDLARKVLVNDFSDAEILKEQEAAQSYIHTITRKTDWDSDDTEYKFIVKIETKLAAVYVLEHYDARKYAEILAQWKQEVNDDIKTVIDSRSDASLDNPIIVIASNYESYPAALEDDEDATPYRSTSVSV